METLLQILDKTTSFFEKKGIENPRLNSEFIFSHVLDCKRLDLYLKFDQPIIAEILDKARPLVKQRAQRKPLQYIFGKTEFYGILLNTDKRALIPRPETEELIELINQKYDGKEPESILDLGTGSGAIAIALATTFAHATVVATDICSNALSLARENIDKHNLENQIKAIESDWFINLSSQFDLIVANPPYLSDAELNEAEPEVREFEPHKALVCSESKGIGHLRNILRSARQFLTPNGLLALETGIEHHAELQNLAAEYKYSRYESHPDLSQRDRFFLAWQ